MISNIVYMGEFGKSRVNKVVWHFTCTCHVH